MAVTGLSRIEEGPASVPDLSLTDPAQAALEGAVWGRLEQYLAHRWTPRTVTWIVEGPGDWTPDLAPVVEITAVEAWQPFAWETTALDPSPLGGFILPGEGPYRVTATVGGGDLPAAVQAAAERLVAYLASDPGKPGAAREAVDLGELRHEIERNPAFMARALQNSGAADLLRPWRRC